jgi:hypothetical protein
MGFRFRRSLRIAPGARLNITKDGISSVSLGERGATLNLGRKGTQGTVGLPGTGMSYSERLGSAPSLGAGLGLAGLLYLAVKGLRGWLSR